MNLLLSEYQYLSSTQPCGANLQIILGDLTL